MYRRLSVMLMIVGCSLVMLVAPTVKAQIGIRNLCPVTGIEVRGPTYETGGIILTSFDRYNLWVYDVERDRRYPLPETFPCTYNCRLSPDMRWLLYFNDLTNAHNRMHLDGTQRSLVSEYASTVDWWSADTWLVWTPGRNAYLLRSDGTRDPIDAAGVISVQPGGNWGLVVETNDDHFERALVNLSDRTQRIDLGIDLAYFDDYGWSPDGTRFAYAAPIFTNDDDIPDGSELLVATPADGSVVQLTRLLEAYGTARINGLATGELHWSPDGREIAFWLVDLGGLDPVESALSATLHIVDVESGATQKYCNFTTEVNTPNPPRLVWSPDSTHIAFGADIPGDEKPNLLLALNIETGVFTILSEGIYPALGAPDVTAWGLPPG
ncbi:MAG: hypothetical protein KC547_12195 [Anaerolineae bacterium]|nr:hypothetical protein [Anaerolineae bacterium]MCA9911597.1 hypothetical protein [Anaerolineae bacterium]